MFHTFIDEAEIEEWFEEEKKKLSRSLYDASYGKKNIESAKKLYDKKFSQLLKRYDKEHRNLTKRLERRRRWNAPRLALKEWWKHKNKARRNRWADRKERFMKWRFNRAYDKLMKK